MTRIGRQLSIGKTDNTSDQRTPRKRLRLIPTDVRESFVPVIPARAVLRQNEWDLTRIAPNRPRAKGSPIEVKGTVRNESGTLLRGALIEIWQANAAGKYLHQNDKNPAPIDPNFAGCGRSLTSSDGYYEFLTIQPGPYPYPNRGIEWRPMHIHFSIFGKSFGQRLITQMYFEGDPLINLCPMVNSIGDEKAKKSLVGILDTSRSNTQNILAYKFDIVLRGVKQTYFENRKEGL